MSSSINFIQNPIFFFLNSKPWKSLTSKLNKSIEKTTIRSGKDKHEKIKTGNWNRKKEGLQIGEMIREGEHQRCHSWLRGVRNEEHRCGHLRFGVQWSLILLPCRFLCFEFFDFSFLSVSSFSGTTKSLIYKGFLCE